MAGKVHAALAHLTHLGLGHATHLASGMEGHVFSIGDDRVAKVWYAKTEQDVTLLQEFYRVLQDLELPFEVPMITQILVTPDGVISVERKLPGAPLSTFVTEDEPGPPPFAVDAIMTVLTALHSQAVRDAASTLPILGVPPSPDATFGTTKRLMLEQLRDRYARYGGQLRRSVADFDHLFAATTRALITIAAAERYPVHGDICPPNILLHPDRSVSGLLDWGLLSHFGDAVFDASVAAGIYDLYGKHHRAIEATLTDACVTRLGLSRDALLVYRAVYAILTSNAYSENGTDGQYAWCVATLNRADIRAAVNRAAS